MSKCRYNLVKECDKDCLNCVLDKIRDEIIQKQYDYMENKDYNDGVRFGLVLAYQIINKY